MPRRALLDNDILLKLSHYNLLNESLVVLGVNVQSIRVLNAARYVLLPTKGRLGKCKDEATAHRLETFLNCAVTISAEELDVDALDQLTGFQSIDPGEAVLIAAAIYDRNIQLVTGDKNAIAALSGYEDLAQLASRLEGRIYSLESVIALLVRKNFGETQRLVRQQPHVDKAIANIFGVSTAASVESVEEGLRSYIRHMRKNTGNLLVDPFTQ